MIQFTKSTPAKYVLSDEITEGELKGTQILYISIGSNDDAEIDIIMPASLPDKQEYIDGIMEDIHNLCLYMVKEIVDELNSKVMNAGSLNSKNLIN